MSKAKVKISVKSGGSGTKIASGEVRISKTNGKPRVTGRPLYQTSAQITLRPKMLRDGRPR